MKERSLVLIGVVLFCATAWAAIPDLGSLTPIVEQLELTPPQKRTLRLLLDRNSKERIRADAELQVIEIDLRRELDKEIPNENRVASYIDRISTAEAKERKSRILTWIRIHKLLTPKQRTVLAETKRAKRGPGESAWDSPLRTSAIHIGSKPAMRLWVDGIRKGYTPQRISGLRPGRHSILLRSHDGKVQKDVIVKLQPGETRKMIYDFRDEMPSGRPRHQTSRTGR